MTEIDTKVEREAWSAPVLESIGDSENVNAAGGMTVDSVFMGDTSS